MSRFGTLLRSVLSSLRTSSTVASRNASTGTPTRRSRSADDEAFAAGGRPGDEPGRFGKAATVEVSPTGVGTVRMTYVPSTDGNPDPGEIVWTWVPYEERDGRGKDRPVLIVAEESAGTRLAVQLTSKDHDGSKEYVPIGRGPWDSEGRPSWVNVDRIFRVHPSGMRREAAAIDRNAYQRVAGALRDLYGWR